MQVLVTGATGVVGRRVVPLLIAHGHRVRALGRSPEKRAALEAQGATAVDGDLLDAPTLHAAVAGCDAVVNLATHIPTTARMMLPGAWAENDRIRGRGSANLVDAALPGGVSRFVQESFAPAYPDCGDRWIEEDTPLEPTAYNRTLFDAETSVARFTEGGRRVGVVLRFGGFYGPDSRFLREFVGFVRRGWVPMPGAPESYVSSISHDDAATSAVAALDLPTGTYNAIDDEPVTRREYFDSLAAVLGVPPPRFPPAWSAKLLGSTGELLGRSERISNRKLTGAARWVPRFPSVREGWCDAVLALERAAA